MEDLFHLRSSLESEPWVPAFAGTGGCVNETGRSRVRYSVSAFRYIEFFGWAKTRSTIGMKVSSGSLS